VELPEMEKPVAKKSFCNRPFDYFMVPIYRFFYLLFLPEKEDERTGVLLPAFAGGRYTGVLLWMFWGRERTAGFLWKLLFVGV